MPTSGISPAPGHAVWPLQAHDDVLATPELPLHLWTNCRVTFSWQFLGTIKENRFIIRGLDNVLELGLLLRDTDAAIGPGPPLTERESNTKDVIALILKWLDDQVTHPRLGCTHVSLLSDADTFLKLFLWDRHSDPN